MREHTGVTEDMGGKGGSLRTWEGMAVTEDMGVHGGHRREVGAHGGH